jgi:hypothetical protein
MGEPRQLGRGVWCSAGSERSDGRSARNQSVCSIRKALAFMACAVLPMVTARSARADWSSPPRALLWWTTYSVTAL